MAKRGLTYYLVQMRFVQGRTTPEDRKRCQAALRERAPDGESIQERVLGEELSGTKISFVERRMNSLRSVGMIKGMHHEFSWMISMTLSIGENRIRGNLDEIER